MNLDLTIDNHVHTSLCRHATGSMEDYVCQAMRMGLKGICFLEHLEVAINYPQRTWLTEEDFDQYFAEGLRLKRNYQDRIRVLLGVEVGFNPDAIDTLLKKIQQRPWDRVGLSYHYILAPGRHNHLNILSRNPDNLAILSKYDMRELLTHYFKALIEAVSTIPADTLCHLDAGFRHLTGICLEPEHFELIECLLQAIKTHSMALEINTSGIRNRGKPYPAASIIRRAVARGIPLVAGSDAHRPEDVGRDFSRLPALLS